ncbi:MAG: hypothetical protein HKN84_07030 [Gammaproteobacteria bacterium]|nr:hypothetical protein [Gammaproteobacteria bacterium]
MTALDNKQELADFTETAIIDRSRIAKVDESQPRTDRRKPSLRGLVYGAFNPRRRRIRRDEDVNHTFIDYHPRHLLVIATLVLICSVIDGLFTVHMISAGLQELNPALAPFVDGNPVIFALVKILFTAVGVIALVVTAQARFLSGVRVSAIFYGLLIAYGCVIVYHLYLLQLI